MNRLKILIVSDDLSFAMIVTDLFNKRGYVVIQETNSSNVLSKCLEQSPNLLLLKLSSFSNFPDAITICDDLRREEKFKELPILLISIDREEAFRVGATAWSDIVFDITEIVKQVHTILTQ